MSDLIHAADVSEYSGCVTRTQWKAARRRGISLAVVGLWNGVRPNPHARDTLNGAALAGLDLAAYIVLNGKPGRATIQDALAPVTGANLRFLALDVELDITEPIFANAVDEVARFGHRPIVYTSEHMWSLHTGNASWGKGLPLWNARYTPAPPKRPGLERPYGGWPGQSVVGVQWAGSDTKLGFNADLSVFKRDWVKQ